MTYVMLFSRKKVFLQVFTSPNIKFFEINHVHLRRRMRIAARGRSLHPHRNRGMPCGPPTYVYWENQRALIYFKDLERDTSSHLGFHSCGKKEIFRARLPMPEGKASQMQDS